MPPIPQTHATKSMHRSLAKMTSALTCALCAGTMAAPSTLACGHCFCLTCLTLHTAKHWDCPTCDMPIGASGLQGGSIRVNPMMVSVAEGLEIIKDTLNKARPEWWKARHDESSDEGEGGADSDTADSPSMPKRRKKSDRNKISVRFRMDEESASDSSDDDAPPKPLHKPSHAPSDANPGGLPASTKIPTSILKPTPASSPAPAKPVPPSPDRSTHTLLHVNLPPTASLAAFPHTLGADALLGATLYVDDTDDTDDDLFLETSNPDATALVQGEGGRSYAFLHAVASGLPVYNVDWLTKPATSPSSDYLVNASGQYLNELMNKSNDGKQVTGTKLFKEFHFFLWGDYESGDAAVVPQPSKVMMVSLLSLGHPQTLKELKKSSQPPLLRESEFTKVVVRNNVTAREIEELRELMGEVWGGGFAADDVDIVSSEWVFDSIAAGRCKDLDVAHSKYIIT